MCGANRYPFATDLLAQLQDRRLDLLVDGAHDLPPRSLPSRHNAYSYALLDEEERTLLRSLGVFVGGFDLATVAAVVADRLKPPAFNPHSMR